MANDSSRPFTLDRVVRLVIGLALLAAAVWLINVLRNVLLPFCLACLLAYMMEPLVELQMRLLRMRSRVLPALLTIIEVTAVLGLLGYFFVPSVIDEINHLDAIIKQNSDKSGTVPFLPDDVVRPIRQWLGRLNIIDLLNSSHFAGLINSGTSFVAATVDFLLHTLEWLLTFIYVIFILIDYPSLMDGFKSLIPARYRAGVARVGRDIGQNMNRYFRCQALIATCAAVFYCIGFSIVGIPLAIVLGVTVGILYMIPYFQYVTLIPVAIVCIIDSSGGTVHFWPEFGSCLLVYVVSQCICDYILTPKIMGKAMGMNPAIILLSLSVWGTLLGLIGMIIALPLTALLLAYYQDFLARHERAET